MVSRASLSKFKHHSGGEAEAAPSDVFVWLQFLLNINYCFRCRCVSESEGLVDEALSKLARMLRQEAKGL